MSTNISNLSREAIARIADKIISENVGESDVPEMPGFKIIRQTDTASGEVVKIAAHLVFEYRGENFCLVQTTSDL